MLLCFKKHKKDSKDTRRKFYNNSLSMNIFKKCCKHGNLLYLCVCLRDTPYTFFNNNINKKFRL